MLSCARPACTGTIKDGWCDLCGLAPPRPEGAPSAAGPAAVEAPATDSDRPWSPSDGGIDDAATRRWGGSARTRTAARRHAADPGEFPPIPSRDPLQAIMPDPTVPEHGRFCGRCRSAVGRSHNDAPGPTEGFCRQCGARYSFTPKLRAGDVVAGQYEVVGCLAHGGLGWIYLAKDTKVANRWVVLKGLLNAADDEAMTAARAELEFLAEVSHQNIVKMFNFAARDGWDYIVMEYVGGDSLKALLEARRERNGGRSSPLPVRVAIEYVLQILPALGYLHDNGLLFCDLKPDNVIRTKDSLKLIDLGGVYRMGSGSGTIYGTTGYQAPELEVEDRAEPSVPSDLYTAARLLAVLCLDFDDVQAQRRHSLPPKRGTPLFERYDALYQLLGKATAPNPDDRFQSAEEMADQLRGVLREVVAHETGEPAPARSTLFTAVFVASHDGPDAQLLPTLLVATDDLAAGWLATLAAAQPDEVISALRRAPQETIEVRLRLAQALIDAQDADELHELLAEIERRDPWEWRAQWYRGVAALAQKLPFAARASFEIVYHAIPGELAPKLALGVCAELAGEHEVAAGWYEIVSRTDPVYSTATFGLARCRMACGDVAGALAAYERVPETSSAHGRAQVARVSCLLAGEPAIDSLAAAAKAIQALDVDARQRAQLHAELLIKALSLVQREPRAADSERSLAGCPLDEVQLRLRLELTYRALAAGAASAGERIRLVDEANAVRPRTWR